MISYRQTPETFIVEELLAYNPSGTGDHVFLKIRKRNMSTHAAKRRLSERTGVPLREIRHAGLKDASATASQWLSWPAAREQQPPTSSPDLEVLAISRHEHGLALGHGAGNRFELTLACRSGSRSLAASDLTTCFPNFYGAQRLVGLPHDPHEVIALIRKPVKDKMLISALQSWLFNRLLQERLAAEGDTGFADDFWTKSNGKRFFQATGDDTLQARYQAGEIAPTGPIFGYKLKLNARETRFLEGWGLQPADFRAWGKIAKGARRPLLTRALDLDVATLADGGFRIGFRLAPGAFATTFLLSSFLREELHRPMAFWPNFTEEVQLDR